MSNVVVIGSQWGDEGKGKIVDWLSSEADVVVRFQGGHNAGHTLVIDGVTYKLRLLPSGIVRKDKISIIGNGVVIDPWALLEEIEEIKSKGVLINSKNLIISESANLILPFHKEMDEIREDAAGKAKIGTTRRGIGPAYEDKIGRRSIRVMDLLSETNLERRLETVLLHHNAIRKGLGKKIYLMDKLKKDLLKIAPEILKFSKPVWKEIDELKKKGKKILFEGAQGILLDVDHGTYPFVTSSNTTSAGACSGLGVPPNKIKNIRGIFKAYTTRVGSGPFPTELFDSTGKKIREVGHEYGATTGRDRRCGWLDLVALKYSIQINGVTELNIMKSDVLSSIDKLYICTSYNLDGEEIDYFPYDITSNKITPNYKEFKGWDDDITQIKIEDDLPDELISYINYIEKFVNVPIKLISVGPDRNQTIIRSR